MTKPRFNYKRPADYPTKEECKLLNQYLFHAIVIVDLEVTSQENAMQIGKAEAAKALAVALPKLQNLLRKYQAEVFYER